jgi:hypothetical protein
VSLPSLRPPGAPPASPAIAGLLYGDTFLDTPPATCVRAYVCMRACVCIRECVRPRKVCRPRHRCCPAPQPPRAPSPPTPPSSLPSLLPAPQPRWPGRPAGAHGRPARPHGRARGRRGGGPGGQGGEEPGGGAGGGGQRCGGRGGGEGLEPRQLTRTVRCVPRLLGSGRGSGRPRDAPSRPVARTLPAWQGSRSPRPSPPPLPPTAAAPPPPWPPLPPRCDGAWCSSVIGCDLGCDLAVVRWCGVKPSLTPPPRLAVPVCPSPASCCHQAVKVPAPLCQSAR